MAEQCSHPGYTSESLGVGWGENLKIHYCPGPDPRDSDITGLGCRVDMGVSLEIPMGSGAVPLILWLLEEGLKYSVETI